MGFGLLAIFHLAYLGAVFNETMTMDCSTNGICKEVHHTWWQTLQKETNGTFTKWRELGFASPGVVGGLFIVNLLF